MGCYFCSSPCQSGLIKARRTLPAQLVKPLLPGRDRPVTALPRADGMLG